jgi:ribosomal protein S18 acetylase RimI-like enzyme
MIETTGVTIREASQEDASATGALSEASQDELGSIGKHRYWLTQQIDRGDVLVAETSEGELVGFVVFNHNPLEEHEHTTVYYLCIHSAYRRHGIGKRLMEAVAVDARLFGNRRIKLKCPTQLSANHFYQRIGYTLERSQAAQEDSRLNVWTLSLRNNL